MSPKQSLREASVQIIDLESDPRGQKRDKKAKQRMREVNRRTDIELVTLMLNPLGHTEEPTITKEVKGDGNYP